MQNFHRRRFETAIIERLSKDICEEDIETGIVASNKEESRSITDTSKALAPCYEATIDALSTRLLSITI